MARVLLISCNTTREPYPVYPLGMTMVAEAVREQGHEVRQCDLLQMDSQSQNVEEVVQSFRPDVVGLALRNIDNIDSADLDAYTDAYGDVSRSVRAATTAPIVLGGAGYSLFPDVLLEQVDADYGIVGEAEVAFSELVEQLTAGGPPVQRILRGDEPLSGARIGALARAQELASFYLQEGGMLNLQSKRGCAHRCAYCTYPLLEGCTYRFRPPADVVNEIEMLRDRFGAEYIAFTDSVFNDQQGHYLSIAEELVRRKNQVPWMAFFRPQRFDRRDVDLLTRAGLHAVEWGTDCTTDATLAGLCKDFTWAHVETSNRLFAGAGVRNAHFVIFGGPDETEQTVQEGLANLDHLDNCVVFAFCGVRILPGTAVHALAVEQGVVKRSDPLLPARFYYSSQVDEETLHETVMHRFDGRIDRIYPMGDELDRVKVFHRLGHRGPIWDLLLDGKGRRQQSRRGAEK
ncbi:MAG: cobalamin-dependent protein [Phycisphaerales bacterium]|nr:MAG: cobalamin-dependent protein [Phycisphaerales bacterium]